MKTPQEILSTLEEALKPRATLTQSRAIFAAENAISTINSLPIDQQQDTYARAIRMIAAQQAKIHTESITDPTTNVFNTRGFELNFADAMARVQEERYKNSIALVLVDLDNFKLVNDRYGHQAGDMVLRATADYFKQAVDKINGRNADVARKGGDEYQLILYRTKHNLLPKITQWLCAEYPTWLASQKELKHIDACQTNATHPLSMSIGAGTLVREIAPKQQYNIIDNALYQSKEAGKGVATVVKVKEEYDRIATESLGRLLSKLNDQ